MTKKEYDIIVKKVSQGVVTASTFIPDDHKEALNKFYELEKSSAAKQVISNTLENYHIARKLSCATCDDTGIPHLILEVGKTKNISGVLLEAISEGVAEGLRALPGRPMAVKGEGVDRIEQSKGLYDDPGMLEHSPILIKKNNSDELSLKILMQGGGPEIRSRTYRVFHKRSMKTVLDEVLVWAKDEVAKLGCTPCSPMIGIGRTHFEATSMMLEAMVDANYNIQSDYEQYFTEELNKSNVGPLGLGGDTTAIGSFIKIGPQRSSGIRVVCMRLACSVEPRYAKVDLT
jgi:fumarate hydratase subunit alpha